MYNLFNDQFKKDLVRLDKTWLDSDLTESRVIKRHLEADNVEYFMKDGRLVGYAEYEYRGLEEIYIKWFVAPKKGMFIFDLLKKFKEDKLVKRITLTVTLDPRESPKAGTARLNLYYSAGFKTEFIEWADNVAFVHMETNN